MNKKRFRTLFNRVRGLVMVVPERAAHRSSVLSVSTGSTSSGHPPLLCPLALRPLHVFVLLAAGYLLTSHSAHADGIVADSAAPANQQPVILDTANGIPQVNIQTPSAAGVSRNTYSQFDVASQGAILNNSRSDVQTQLGGYVQANPYLAAASARVILNEVNSSNPSQLHGYIEVAGSRAQVVIASPAGISCDGCGFINANRATLTTGTAIFNNGNLEGYRVQRGTINIFGNGMDSRQTDYTDIIARAVQVNANLFANDLRVTTGSHQVNVAGDGSVTSTTSISSSGTAPSVAIDVAQLGGMYAGKIYLIGTEAGVGVTNAGHIGASAGEVRVDVNGILINAPSGRINSRQDMQINASAGITNAGTLYALGNSTLSTQGDINTTGTIAALGHVNLTAAGTSSAINSNETSLIAAGLDADGRLVNAPDQAALLTIDSVGLTGAGRLLSNGNITTTLGSDYLHTGEWQAYGDLRLMTTGSLSNEAKLLAGKMLQLSAAAIDNRVNAEIVGTRVDVNTTSHAITNRGLINGQDTLIQAGTVHNVGTGRIYGDHLAIWTSSLTNTDETIAGATTAAVIGARNRLDLAASYMTNREHALIFSAGDMAIGADLDANYQATGTALLFNNRSAIVEALGNLSLNASEINNTDEHFSTHDVLVSNQGYDEFQGQGGVNRYTTPAGTPIHPNIPYCGDDCFNAYNSPAPNGNAYATSVRNALYQWVIGGQQYRNAYRYVYTRNTVETQIQRSDPAKIIAGNALQINATQLLNDKSQIIAGGALTAAVGTLNNTTLSGQRISTDSGTTYLYVTHDPGGGGNDYTEIRSTAYAPVASVQALELTPTVYRQYTAATGNGASAASMDAISQDHLSISDISIPNSSFFRVNPNAGSHYLVETDPRFADYRRWLSSDYLLQQMSVDPTTMQKRLGDGFYEQKLIREQVAQLTGRRFISGYANDEVQYQALMNNAATVAQAWQLVPGIALSATQVAQLTSDIVWLVEKTVTLPDGTYTQALVPQVYLHIHPGDLDGHGALIAADKLDLQLGVINNSGTIAGRQLVAITADGINNIGGRITGGSVNLTAHQDINNLGGQIDAANSLSLSAGRDITVQSTTSTQDNAVGSRTNIDRVAGLYVTGNQGLLVASAGQDLNLLGATISNHATDDPMGQSASQTQIVAGRDVNLGTVVSSEQHTIFWDPLNTLNSARSQEHGTTIQSTGDLTINAGRDLQANAASLISHHGDLTATAGNSITIGTGLSTATSQGNTSYGYGSTRSTASVETHTTSSLTAGKTLNLQSGADTHLTSAQLAAGNALSINTTGNLTLDAAKDNNQLDYAYQANNKRDIVQTNDETVLGSQLNAGNNITLNAQTNTTTGNGGTLTLNSTDITSQNGAVSLNADLSITIGSTDETHERYEEHYTKSRSLLSSKSTLTIDQASSTHAVGSTVSGDTVFVNVANDLAIEGSNVVSTNGTTLNAGGNITIQAAQNTAEERHFNEIKKSGFMNSGGLGFTVGKQQLTNTQTSQSVTHTASTVGSTDGDVTIQAGKAYTQTGSDVLAPQGDIAITAQSVDINAAQDTSINTQQTKFKQTGITVSVSNPVISAVQTAQQMASAASQTSDGRMQALAAATTALAAKNAYDAVQAGQAIKNGTTADKLGGINVSVSLGTSKSQSDSMQTSSTAQGSSLSAGQDINITATGAGTTSDITIVGSQVKAGDNVTFKADDQISLVAAQNTDTLNSTNKSSSASVGLSYGTSGLLFNASASGSKGNANGQDITWKESVVQAGKQSGNNVTLQSGTDLSLIGAQVNGNQVIADVGRSGTGSLHIQSLQDTSTYNDKQQSSGGSISVGAGKLAGSINSSNSKANSVYVSVNEQSGIYAGDGGFQVKVNGNTNLNGAVIVSSQTAIDQKKNSLSTETITVADIKNLAEYSASSESSGVALSYDGSKSVTKNVGNNLVNAPSTLIPGLARNGEDNSVTRSAISEGAILITDSAKQQELTGQDAQATIASINRDTANANSAPLDKPDVQTVQHELQVGSEIISAATSEVVLTINNYYEKRIAEYDEQYKQKIEGAQTKELQAKELSANGDTQAANKLISEAQSLRAQAIDIRNERDNPTVSQGLTLALGSALISGLGTGQVDIGNASTAYSIGTLGDKFLLVAQKRDSDIAQGFIVTCNETPASCAKKASELQDINNPDVPLKQRIKELQKLQTKPDDQGNTKSVFQITIVDSNSAGDKNVAVNGILNEPDRAMVLAIGHLRGDKKEQSLYLSYNDTQGGFADLLNAAIDKYTDSSSNPSLMLGQALIAAKNGDDNAQIYLYAHSGGTLISTIALNNLGNSGQTMNGLHVDYFGPAASISSAAEAAINAAGLSNATTAEKLNWLQYGNTTGLPNGISSDLVQDYINNNHGAGYYNHTNDPVATFVGGNFGTTDSYQGINLVGQLSGSETRNTLQSIMEIQALLNTNNSAHSTYRWNDPKTWPTQTILPAPSNPVTSEAP